MYSSRQVAGTRRAWECGRVVEYPPPIFHAVKRLTAGSLVFDAIRRGVAIYSPHTALDVAEGGTNDMLADAIGLGGGQALQRIGPKRRQRRVSVVGPADGLGKVRDAVFAAGVGGTGG